jgi:hypothetical protein
MSAENLLGNRKASQIFFSLLRKRARPDGLAKTLKLKKTEVKNLLARMVKTGILTEKRGLFGIDWERFLPIFLRQAMNIYSAAMPWKYIPLYMEKGEEDFIEASCAQAERELAKVKMQLAASDLFCGVVQSYFLILATETWAPEDYLEDLRVLDAIDEFEYALLKLLPGIRRKKRTSREAKVVFRLLNEWYRQIQGYDTPAGAALRAAFGEKGLL